MQTFGTLKELAAAVRAIHGVMRRADRDLSILDQELSGRANDAAEIFKISCLGEWQGAQAKYGCDQFGLQVHLIPRFVQGCLIRNSDIA